MRIFIFVALLFIGVLVWQAIPVHSVVRSVDRINGVCVVNPSRPISADVMADVKRVNAGWVAVIPYAFSVSSAPEVVFDHPLQWWGERTKGNCMLVKYAKENGLKVMVKPHVWVRGEGWTGDFDLASEEDWKIWEQDYSKYILNHAVKADSMGVEILCIGTEYRTPAKERPIFWRSLIKEVRKVYDGKVTYAANWDNYSNITWWDAVDYIGVDAYFPLLDDNDPSLEEIKNGWFPVKEELSGFSKKWNKPILFTEYGFQSIDGATGKHWEMDNMVGRRNLKLQADAYEATFQVLEEENWYAGGFFWKWHFTGQMGEDVYKRKWTPQNKLAEKVIAKWYGR